MRLLFSFRDPRRERLRPVRDYEIEHLKAAGNQILAEWRWRERTQTGGRALTLAIAGVAPAIGYFWLELSAAELFFVLVADAFVMLVADWIKYWVAPFQTEREIATADQNLQSLDIVAAYLERKPGREMEVADHDQSGGELLKQAFAEATVYGLMVLGLTIIVLLLKGHRITAASWWLLGAVSAAHLAQAAVTGYRAREAEKLEPQLTPQSSELNFLISAVTLVTIAVGSMLSLNTPRTSSLFFGLLATAATAVVVLWMRRLVCRRALLERFIRVAGPR